MVWLLYQSSNFEYYILKEKFKKEKEIQFSVMTY